MVKLLRSNFHLGMIVAVLGIATSLPASAADMVLPARVAHQQIPCGRCGCLRVTWERHRVVEMTYGTNFDPRNFDQTEPYFYLGRMKAYPHYTVEADSGELQ